MNDHTDSAHAYANIVDLYDLEHDEFQDDLDVIGELAATANGPVLELGCGSGRVLAPLAEAGYEATGVDLSQPMLEMAQSRLADIPNHRVTLWHGDMRQATNAPGGPFGLAAFTLNGLMHLPSLETQRHALESAAATLRPGGMLFVDIMHPVPDQLRFLSDGPQLERSWPTDDGGTIDKWSYRTFNASEQMIDTVLWYDSIDPDGSLRRVRTSFTMRYLHEAEFRLLLELTGFEDVRVFGDYDLTPIHDEADRLLVVATKV